MNDALENNMRKMGITLSELLGKLYRQLFCMSTECRVTMQKAHRSVGFRHHSVTNEMEESTLTVPRVLPN